MVGDLIMRALYGSPIQEAYGGGGGPIPPGGLVGAMTGQGGQAASQGPAIAPAQATQSPPDMAKANAQIAQNPNIVQLYLRQEQLNRAADQFDRGLEGLVLSKTPPSMQSGVIASMSPQPRTDAGTQLQNLMGLQQGDMRMRAFFNLLTPNAQGVAPIDTMAQQFGVDPGALRNMVQLDPTVLSKMLEMQAGIGGPPETQEWRQAVAQFHRDHPGQPLPPELQSALTYGGAKQEEGRKMAQIGEEKAGAVESFPALDKTYNTLEDRLKWLNDPAHRDAVVNAIQKPELFTTGQAGRWLGGTAIGQGITGVDQDTMTAKGYLDQVRDELFSANFTGTKNVRNLTEANKLQGSASNLFKPTNNAATIKDELDRLTKETMKSHATIMATAGKQIPYQYKGMADTNYLDPKSPYYNGATEQEPPKEEETSPPDQPSPTRIPMWNRDKSRFE